MSNNKNINEMELISNENYTNKLDTYLIYTFTGKTKKSSNCTGNQLGYEFIEKPKNLNNKWLKPRKVWKSKSFVNNYFVKH